jgi:hypothetical protein
MLVLRRFAPTDVAIRSYNPPHVFFADQMFARAYVSEESAD